MLNQYMHEVYDSSIDVATIGFALAKQTGHFSPDHIMLAGLLHNIGVITIIGYIEETGLLIADENQLDEIIQRLRCAVSCMVIRNWGLSDGFLEVVDNYENWQRASTVELDSCDMVIIAQVYHRLKKHQLDGLPVITQVPAFKKLFPEKQDAEFAKNVFHLAHEEIASVMRLLKI